ncbi:MAG: exopolysaccharide biosynthesis polyprenyl glycosylphosphotransferase [Chthoniobacteraceae bacterium]|jgi:exopolysaccharide biosynthesis polyprenyl glycosylphosphotransferase
MISHRVRGLSLMHGLLQTLFLLLLFWVWMLVFTICLHQRFLREQYVAYAIVLVVTSLLDLGRSKLTRKDLLQLDVVRVHNLSIRQAAVIVGGLLLFLVASKDVAISRLFLFTFAPAAYLLLFLTNMLCPRWLASLLFSGRSSAKTLVLGSMDDAVKLNPWLERKVRYGLHLVGLITTNPGHEEPCHLPVVGDFSEIAGILQKTEATKLIVLDLSLEPEQMVDLADLCDKFGLRLLFVNDLEEKFHRSINFFDDDGFHFMEFRREPLECPMGRTIKRTLDLIVAIPVVLFILPPVSLVIWFLQRRQAPGPLFFRQRRTGKYNRPFLIYKFRTMYVGNPDEGRQVAANDSRVYPAGGWMRKLSIDEIPQFINVLIGEMSVVGPRPHFVDHDTLFGEIAHFYRVRSFIKPGITGLAQVRGLRGEARVERDLIDRIRSDVYYLENWSPVLDWMIILKTAWQMVAPPKTAY